MLLHPSCEYRAMDLWPARGMVILVDLLKPRSTVGLRNRLSRAVAGIFLTRAVQRVGGFW